MTRNHRCETVQAERQQLRCARWQHLPDPRHLVIKRDRNIFTSYVRIESNFFSLQIQKMKIFKIKIFRGSCCDWKKSIPISNLET